MFPYNRIEGFTTLTVYICGMKNSSTPFNRAMLLAGGALMAADGLLHYAKPELHPFRWGGLIIGAMLLLYLVSHAYARRIAQKEPKKFVTAFMAFSGIKLLVLALLVVLAFVLDKEHRKESAIIIISSYLVFTLIDWRFSKDFLRGANN